MSKRIPTLLISLLSLVLPLLAGCQRSVAPVVIAPTADADPDLFSKVEINDRLRTVRSTLRAMGELCKHADLPISPKPQEMYPKLPVDTQYWLWKSPKATLVLGLSPDERVVFKGIAAERESGSTLNAQIEDRYQ